MLSNQAFYVGKSLGLIAQGCKHGGIYSYSAVQGYHVSKCLELAVGEKRHEEQEHDNTVDKFAVKVV